MIPKEYIELINEQFNSLKSIIPQYFQSLENKISRTCPNEEILLKYLYANMPISDIGNYPFDTYLDYAHHGALLMEIGAFNKEIPPNIFLEYIVYHRINTENIDPCRSFFYNKSKECINPNSMEETIKSINYWCSSQATYRASDERTASPMTVYESGFGRCGEESTFVVSVLRANGIPARQIYAPRWSHCDDNHAWVEVWCNGKWRFLGACEPEEILDRGWFTSASSRAMLLHTRYYGNIPSNEDLINNGTFVKELNQISRYAKYKNLAINVIDEKNNPIEAATVNIEVLNYSQFVRVTQFKTNSMGKGNIDLGLGSIRIHVSKNDIHAFKVINTRKVDTITIQLTNKRKSENWEDIIIYAPTDCDMNFSTITDEQKQATKEKLKYANDMRDKVKTNPNDIEKNKWFNLEIDEILKNQLYSTLSQKDLLDFKADVLADHGLYSKKYRKYENIDETIFIDYILAPRIDIETLSPYKKFILDFFSSKTKEGFQENPTLIWEYIKNNISETYREYQELISIPMTCLKLGMGNKKSKYILFVAICRSLGIPARLSPMDGAMEYYRDNGFIRVLAEDELNGSLSLIMDPDVKWVYEENYSISKVINGENKLIKTNERDILLASGEYEITTQNRLPNGNIYCKTISININPKEKEICKLTLKEASLPEMLNSINLPSFDLLDANNTRHTSTNILEDNINLCIYLEESAEPTEHILNEIMDRKEDFEALNISILFVAKNLDSFQNRNIKRVLKAIPNIQCYRANVEEEINFLGRRLYVNPETLPLIFLTDKSQCSIYATSGYNVGTADMILKILNLTK